MDYQGKMSTIGFTAGIDFDYYIWENLSLFLGVALKYLAVQKKYRFKNLGGFNEEAKLSINRVDPIIGAGLTLHFWDMD